MSQLQSKQDNHGRAPNPSREANPDNHEANEDIQYARLNPELPRLHADDQDKKTVCIFWVVLLCALFLIVIIAHFAVPDLYQDHPRGKNNKYNCSFPGTPIISGQEIVCGNYYMNNKLGEVIFGWNELNQFALTSVEVIPINLQTQLNFNTQITIALYDIKSFYNQTAGGTQFTVLSQASSVTTTFDFKSTGADKLYAGDEQTVLGYEQLVAVVTKLENKPFFIEISFAQTFSPQQIAGTYSQSKAVSSQFTAYTIVIRYVFFAIAVGTLILYLLRFVKVPTKKKIIEQYFVAGLSVLLLMFNDPFYPITILKPNGGSAFFSILFVVNLVVTLFLFWLVTADRIYFDDGQLMTEQFTWKKIVYTGILWIQMMVVTMIYSMQQINSSPILTNDFNRRFLIARIIIIITLIIAVLYIGYRYGQICASETPKLWRSYIFIVFSIIFIVAMFIIVASNSLIPYHYEGSAIFLVYGFVNLYVYYIQFMFTITREQSQKLQQLQQEGGVENPHEGLTIGSIDIVDIDLSEDGRKVNKQQSYGELNVEEQNSQVPVSKKNVQEEYDDYALD